MDKNDTSGYSVSGAGDINGDKYDDIIIGAYNAGSGKKGESYVVFGGNFVGPSSTEPSLSGDDLSDDSLLARSHDSEISVGRQTPPDASGVADDFSGNTVRDDCLGGPMDAQIRTGDGSDHLRANTALLDHEEE